jgi:hypothetical protein
MFSVAMGRRLAMLCRYAAPVFAALLLIANTTPACAATDEKAKPKISAVRVGIAGHYKIGHWTRVEVEVSDAAAIAKPKVTVTVPDNDGVQATSTAELLRSGGDGDTGAVGVANLFTCVGRLGAATDVAVYDGDQLVESQTVKAGNGSLGTQNVVELHATAELILFLGTANDALIGSFDRRSDDGQRVARKAVRVSDVKELPRAWLGYDGVDLVILPTSSRQLCEALSNDAERFAALLRWIELGGRLVLFADGESAETLFAGDRPLSKLLPGRFADIVRLPETGRLEHFAGSDVSIGGSQRRGAMEVPRLENVVGQIEVYEGRRPTDLPLVVRGPRGLGEVTFVAVDPTRPPIADWPGRAAFLQAVLRPYADDGDGAAAAQTLVTRGYNDLSGALRQRVGRTFSGARPVAFSYVTIFALAYLAVLGPLDYFVVRRWFKRSLMAWLTFPLIVLLFGGLALGIAEKRRAVGRQVNQIELVDVDATSGLARGTVWAALFSPNADRLDLQLEVAPVTAVRETAAAQAHSWPLPGAGIGGTQAGGLNLAMAGGGYSYADEYGGLVGVPILANGTKSLIARWTAPIEPLVAAELADADGVVAGTIENVTRHRLRNVRLFYREWAYRLGTLAAGATVDVGQGESPRNLKTIVTQDSFGGTAGNRGDATVFAADRASTAEILNVMMFYDAVGGFAFARLPNRYQDYCDLSRMPALGRAVLVAEVDTPGSRFVDADGTSPAANEDSATVIYRIVLPVK